MVFLRSLRSVFALATLVAGITACNANRIANALPETAVPLVTRERMLQTLVVDDRSAQSIANLVEYKGRPAIYYGPAYGAPANRQSSGNPKNLTYYGGPVIVREAAYDLYINCPDGSCWGDPGSLSARLGTSQYIHVADQYMKPRMVSTNGRYTYAGGIYVPFKTKTLTEGHLLAMLHDAASQYGTGLTKIYHVFANKDTGLCTDINPTCKVDYCGYHSSVKFKDIGLVIYSVEAYPRTGCFVPNGKLNDSVDSTLVHEIFETITDPLVGVKNGWYNENTDPTGSSYGEIADYCTSYGYPSIGRPRTQVQTVWSNALQKCTFQP